MSGFKVFLLLFWTVAAWEGRLEINADRQFRIVQFSDLHLGEDDGKDQETLLVMGRVLERNPCELAVITGDLLSDYAHISEERAKAILTKLNGVFEKRAVPYFFVKGNHDHYIGLGESQYIAFMQQFRLCLTVEGAPGSTTFVVPIYHLTNLVYTLWAIDGSLGVRNSWGRLTVNEKAFIEQTGIFYKGVPNLKGIAFKHTPTVEFTYLAQLQKLKGVVGEAVMCSKDEPSLLEIVRPYGIIEGILVGHDHKNTYSGWYQGVYLAYGAKTGRSGYDSNSTGIAKLIVLELGGQNKVSFHDTFLDEQGKVLPEEVFTQKVSIQKGKCQANGFTAQTYIAATACLLAGIALVINYFRSHEKKRRN